MKFRPPCFRNPRLYACLISYVCICALTENREACSIDRWREPRLSWPCEQAGSSSHRRAAVQLAADITPAETSAADTPPADARCSSPASPTASELGRAGGVPACVFVLQLASSTAGAIIGLATGMGLFARSKLGLLDPDGRRELSATVATSRVPKESCSV